MDYGRREPRERHLPMVSGYDTPATVDRSWHLPRIVSINCECAVCRGAGVRLQRERDRGVKERALRGMDREQERATVRERGQALGASRLQIKRQSLAHISRSIVRNNL